MDVSSQLDRCVPRRCLLRLAAPGGDYLVACSFSKRIGASENTQSSGTFTKTLLRSDGFLPKPRICNHKKTRSFQVTKKTHSIRAGWTGASRGGVSCVWRRLVATTSSLAPFRNESRYARKEGRSADPPCLPTGTDFRT